MLTRLGARRAYHEWGRIRDAREYLRRMLELQDRDQVADAILSQAPGRRLPVAVDGCKDTPEPTCVTARQVMSNDLQDLPDFAHVRTALRYPAAFISGIP
jgi:hypothetical protein